VPLSVRAAAKKLKIVRSTVCDIKLRGCRSPQKQTERLPKYTVGQEGLGKIECQKISEKVREKVQVFDDVSRVQFEPPQVLGLCFFNVSDHKELDFKHKFKPTTKFARPFLL
jgi:hypothetical protein